MVCCDQNIDCRWCGQRTCCQCVETSDCDFDAPPKQPATFAGTTSGICKHGAMSRSILCLDSSLCSPGTLGQFKVVDGTHRRATWLSLTVLWRSTSLPLGGRPPSLSMGCCPKANQSGKVSSRTAHSDEAALTEPSMPASHAAARLAKRVWYSIGAALDGKRLQAYAAVGRETKSGPSGLPVRLWLSPRSPPQCSRQRSREDNGESGKNEIVKGVLRGVVPCGPLSL